MGEHDFEKEKACIFFEKTAVAKIPDVNLQEKDSIQVSKKTIEQH
jgi:hypothetical protein